MKITVLALGSRGDVQPLIALGLGLQKAGCQVHIATHTCFQQAVRSEELGFFPVRGDPRVALGRGPGQLAMGKGGNPVLSLVHFMRTTHPLVLQAGHDCWAACQATDAILYSVLGFYIAPHIAERLHVPCIGAFVEPIHRTHAFPSFISSTQHGMGAIPNWMTHVVGQAVMLLSHASVVNRFRREGLGLRPIRRWIDYGVSWQRRMPVVYGFSPVVVPKPPDWGDNIEITGSWFLTTPASWKPSRPLARFLSDGPAPVYVGFGSMSSRDSLRVTDIVLRALRRAGQRGLLATGWGGLNHVDSSHDVFLVESVPHDRLFPHMAAVVHHGGAGTTAAGLRAGVPSIAVPFFLDQPFWGQRIRDLGVGPPPIPHRLLSVDRLAGAIDLAVRDGKMRARASALGAHIRAEDGVARAVEAIRRSARPCHQMTQTGH